MIGNRAVITTEGDIDNRSGTGVYIHWNGSRDSVEGFLTYCRIRGFRSPEHDCYGWARLCQILSNFFGPDGCSVGVDDVSRLDTDNGDNGTYLIRDWRITGRRYCDEDLDAHYPLDGFLCHLDSCQPEGQQLGQDMIRCLLHHDMSILQVNDDYFDEIVSRKENNVITGRYEIGKHYYMDSNDLERTFEVVGRSDYELSIDVDGTVMTVPLFMWKDNSESTIIKYEGRELHPESPWVVR